MSHDYNLYLLTVTKALFRKYEVYNNNIIIIYFYVLDIIVSFVTITKRCSKIHNKKQQTTGR